MNFKISGIAFDGEEGFLFKCVLSYSCLQTNVLKTPGDVQLFLSEEHSSSAENSQNTNFWLTC